ncbi:MAG: Ig-like domain-containing protein [Candidatus Gastranaerophilales bacterium]|nr:Ig-like domain-containing protein [Candidatus Gastranaerophilales bacterium]
MKGWTKRSSSRSRAMALTLSAAMLASNILGGQYVYAVEGDSVTMDPGGTVSGSDVVTTDPEGAVPGTDAVTPDPEGTGSGSDVVAAGPEETVSGSDANVNPGGVLQAQPMKSVSDSNQSLFTTGGDYTDFLTDEKVADLNFGTDVTTSNAYEDGKGGFSDITWQEAKGWVGSIYYPRESSKTPGVTYVADAAGSLAIKSKVWTETESTGYGVFTYEETAEYDIPVDNADFKVAVTLVNPGSTEYTAYLEAEDITRVTDITVAPNASVTKEFNASVVDGSLSLKFLGKSDATSADAAAEQTVYVANVTATRLATNAPGAKPTIYLASDSTVQTYEDVYDPQTGWGETLAMFFGGDVEERPASDCTYGQARVYEAANVIVENRAIGGRSSKSFIDEGKLDDLLEDIRPGDYLFVQWGHNDATSSRPNRYVSPEDFKIWIQYYVDGALQRGATPVLVTPVARYSYDEKSGSFVGNFEAYGDVMRSMAQEQGLALIDLTARSLAVCNNFGKDGARSLFLMVEAGEYPNGNYAGGANDSTHLQWYGAYKFSQCVAQGIQESDKLTDLAEKVVMSIPETAPGAVTELKSGTVGASSVSMSWNEATGAELYYIYRQELADGATADSVDFSSADKYSVSVKASYTDSKCEAGKTYVYAVRAFNEKGLGEISNKITVTTKEAGWKFDFNYNNSPTLAGWIGINQNFAYDAKLGYGFTKAPGDGRNRGKDTGCADATGPLGDMGIDFVLGESIFELDVPNGDYEITGYGGDMLKPDASTISSRFTAEGVSIGGTSSKGAIGSFTATVRVEDGKLTIGNSGYMMGLTVTEILKAPSALAVREASVKGSNYEFSLGFVGVDEAVKYNVYRKGTTDKEFALIKSFTVEQYKEDELGCQQQNVLLGDTYEYYMTCVTADGTESARSAIYTVKAVLDGVPAPAAPENVRCTSPTEDVEELQRFVTIEWDAVPAVTGEDNKQYSVIRYNIYRSDRAEGDKGFKEFVKVAEVTSGTSYTDESVQTNIPYYYKVTAVNAGGEGKESDVCKTPVTGSFVTGGREKYTDRALVAVNLSGGKGATTLISATGPDGQELTSGVYLSWRAFEADMADNSQLSTTFDVYRDGAVIASGIKVTNMVDEGGTASSVYKVVGSNDSAIGVHSVDTKCWANQYLELSLFKPADETMPDNTSCTFSANDMSVGDLDGDGDLELIVKWYPSNAKDNSGSGYTGNTYLDGYDVNWATGEVGLLWRINLGVNIRSGAHYTQFQVWDYDGDRKAEIAIKTGDGTTSYKSTDGTANNLVMNGYVGEASDQELTISENHGAAKYDYRETSGYVIPAEGHEYFSIFNGEDGTKAAEDVPYEPFGGNATSWGDNSDGYRNRIDRFLSGTAYLDGETPFAVFCRGYYTRTCMTAYYMKDTDGDRVGDTIEVYWKFDTKEAGSQYEAQGNHGLSINDVDNDGKDEIIYGSLTVDHDGTVKYSTGLGHGDAMHVSDWIPQNPGLEIMDVHEHDDATYHVEVHDAETGEILMGYWTGRDTGRGVAADIDPTSVGAEWWSIASPTWTPEGDEDEPAWNSTRGIVYAASSGVGVSNLVALSHDKTPAANFSIFWDGDLLSEVLDHNFNTENGAYDPVGVTISKWDWENEKQDTLLYSEEIWSNNGTKGNVGLAADILGDWREEIITRTSGDASKVRIYTTTIQTDYVVPCLLEDLAYREGVAWQNVGYNQPANLSYLLSEGLVTSQLSEGEVEAESAEVLFTEASDGTYGHEITGYEIYRKLAGSDGDYEKIDTLTLDQLIESSGGGNGNGGSTEPEPPKDEVLFEEDFEGTSHSFKLNTESYSTHEYWEKDTSTVNTNPSDHVYGVGARGGDTGTQLATALGISENVTVEFDIKMDGCVQDKSSNFSLTGAKNTDNWLSTTSQILTITASANGNGYWNTITVNGQDITAKAKVSNGTNNGESSGKGGQLRDTTGWLRVVAALNFETQKIDLTITRISDNSEVYKGEVNFVNTVSSLEYIYMAGAKNYGGVFTDNIRIVKKAEVPEPDEKDPSEEEVIIKKELLFEEDFEGTSHSFKLNTESYSTHEYWEKDTSTVNTNPSDHVYGVGARGGDTGTQLATALGISENVTVEFDIKMDGCVQDKSSNFSLTGAKNTDNWLSTTSQILTITASANGNGYWNTITVNGQDITAKAKVSNGTNNGESSGKGGQLRDTTGWLRVVAALNFETQKIDLTITRISDNSEVYKGEVNFVNTVSSLEYIYMAGAKNYGGVFTDNIEIYKKVEVKVPSGDDNNPSSNTKTYVYTDTKDLTPATTYSYKVAAIVDGKTSFMSRPLEIETADKVTDVPALDPVTIYEKTPVEDGKTAASLLPQTVTVTTEDGTKENKITWDITGLDINKVGVYNVTGKIKGWPTPIPLTVNVLENAVKGYVDFEDITIVVGHGDMLKLPENVEVEWMNTTKTKVVITWDTSGLDTDTIGDYTLQGAVKNSEDKRPIVVHVVENYITSVPKAYGEVIYMSTDVAAQIPATIPANYAAGDQQEVSVTWDADSVSAINSGEIGTYSITGTVDGYEGEVTADIKVVYRPVYRFDFGINANEAAEDWTAVTVNVKDGKQTANDLGIAYSTEKGYGFQSGTAIIEGRSESYNHAGVLPKLVYKDFVIPDGQTFVVDLPNGTYEVEVVSGSYYNSNVKGSVEGVAFSIGNSAESYAVYTANVKMSDGQLTCEFNSGNTSRMDAIIVRLVEADKTALKAAIDGADVLVGSEDRYQPEAWPAFIEALEAAKEVYDAVYPSCEEVNDATQALKAARDALKLKPDAVDKAALKAAVDAAEELTEDVYTEESWAPFAEKLEAAKAVLENEEATADEVEAARTELLEAQAALVQKPATVTGVSTPVIGYLTVGMTEEELAEKLPKEVDVTYSDGTTGKAAATWDVSEVDLSNAGVYDAYVTVEGWELPIPCQLTVIKEVTLKVEESEGVPKIEVPAISGEQLVEFLTDEDKGKLTLGVEIKLGLNVEAASEDGIPENVQTALNTIVNQNSLKVAMKLDINFVKYISGEEPQYITEANRLLGLVITIPETYRTSVPAGYTREFFVVRTHVAADGTVETTILEDQDKDADTITIATDKFSVYAIAYKDTEKKVEPVKPADPAPADDGQDQGSESEAAQPVATAAQQTGDQTNIWVWFILLAVCVGGIAAVFGTKYYRNKRGS